LGRTDPETRFWDNLRHAPKLPENQAREKKAGSLPRSAVASRARLRDELPGTLRELVVEELKRDYPSANTDPNQAPEIHKTIEGIRFTVQRIRGGSLEVLLFVLGFARLAQAIGITPEEFSKYMDIAAPTAMSLIFGVTSGAVVANTTEVGEPGTPSESGGAAESRPRVESSIPSMTSLYFMPALFAAVAVGSMLYAFLQISSRLADDRAAYSGYLHDEMQNISKERHDIADKLATLISQHDSALAAAQKTLFDDQMTLLKNASAAAAERDNAVVDLVKARLIPTPFEPPPPSAPVKPTLIDLETANALCA
jgi:hypothetical protein